MSGVGSIELFEPPAARTRNGASSRARSRAAGARTPRFTGHKRNTDYERSAFIDEDVIAKAARLLWSFVKAVVIQSFYLFLYALNPKYLAGISNEINSIKITIDASITHSARPIRSIVGTSLTMVFVSVGLLKSDSIGSKK